VGQDGEAEQVSVTAEPVLGFPHQLVMLGLKENEELSLFKSYQ
jgi:hypothetical protein